MDNVGSILPCRKVLQDTEEQFMKESNFLVDNVAKNLPLRVMLQNTKELFMKEFNIHTYYSEKKEGIWSSFAKKSLASLLQLAALERIKLS